MTQPKCVRNGEQHDVHYLTRSEMRAIMYCMTVIVKPNAGLGVALAAEVRAELARQNKPSSKLASSTRLQRTALSRRLNGHQPFNVDDLGAIAAALDLPASANYATTPPTARPCPRPALA